MPTIKHPRDSREYADAHISNTTHEFGDQGRQYAILGTLLRIEDALAALAKPAPEVKAPAKVVAPNVVSESPAPPKRKRTKRVE